MVERLSLLPVFCGSRCWPLVVCRVVLVLVILVLAVVLALRGYAPGAITGGVLVLVEGAVAVADRLVGSQCVRSVSALPAP
jgi:hypothetical protein